jgi:ribonuclease HI
MCIWTLVSDSILSVHRRLCSGVTLRHAANDETSERYADSYVDDTDVYAGHDGPETFPEITDDMDPRTEEDEEVQMTVFNLQKASQAMTNLINYLGHSMAFHKCLWQLSAWKQKDGRAVQREHEESHGEIILEDHNGVKSKIKRMKHTEPNEGLGFLIAPTGNQEPEYTKRLKQARECMARILPVQLTLREAWLALVTRVLPKVTYPFKLTRFTKKQLKRLSIVIDNVMLPKMGINRKMKRAVIYAPLELGGIGYPSIETIQDQQSIGHFVRHLQWGKEIATDLKIALSHAQLQSGMVTPILDDTTANIPYLEPGQIKHIRERLTHLKGSIWIEKVWTPPLQRIGDQSLMAAFLKVRASGASLPRLQLANEYRMWLRVITVADMADYNGTRISPEKLNGTWRAPSSLKGWPNLPRPSEKMKEAFWFYLRHSICSRPGRASKNRPLPLDDHLGPWIEADRHIQHEFYRTETWTYVRRENEQGEITLTRYSESTNLHETFHHESEVERIPTHAHPVDGVVQNTTFHPYHQYSFSANQLQQDNPPNEDDGTTSHLPEEVLHAEHITGVSDGSMDPVSGKAAYAWVLTQPNRNAWIKRSKSARSNPKYMTSFRAELLGVHDMIKYLAEKRLATATITLWCDNKGVIDVLDLEKPPSLTAVSKAEGDLVKATRVLLEPMPNIELCHVHGHQDDDINYEDLPLESQLNIDCDEEAKACRLNENDGEGRPPPIEGTGATLYLNDEMVTTEMNEQIQYAAHAGPMKTYLGQKFEWTDQQVETINWPAMRLAKRRLKMHKSIRISKMMHNWLNDGHQKAKMEQDGKCPCCGKEEEDIIHMYRCEHPPMRTALEQGITNASQTLHNNNVPASTAIAFVESIRRVTESTRPPKQYHCEEADAAVTAQETLGPFAILRDHHHIRWLEAITNTHRRRPAPPGAKPQREKSPLELSVLLITTAWSIFESIWEVRNSTLHDNDSFAAKAEESQLTERLLIYRRKRAKMLYHGDHHLIEFPEGDIVGWDRKRKRSLLRTLDTCNRRYILDCETLEDGQQLLTSYFQPILTTLDEDEDGSVSSGDEMDND